MRRTLVATAAVALVLAGPASATVVRWNETATLQHQKAMRYVVDSITVGKSTWSARITFVNTSKKTIEVGEQFGIAFYEKRSQSSLSDAAGFAEATATSSALPKRMAPGASWTGTISGKGTLTITDTLYARVVFGPFTGLPGETSSVYWITNHSLPIYPPPSAGNVA